MSLFVGLALQCRADESISAMLRVTVTDPQGLAVPRALVVGRADGRRWPQRTDSSGVVTLSDLTPGAIHVQVSASGFRAHETWVTLATGARERLQVRLELAPREERVEVRPPLPFRATPRVLTTREIAQLPDDPDEMAEALERMAGPGAIIQVDGFRGGTLPHKSEIREIRFQLDPYAAENHEIGYVFIDIVTRPPAGPWNRTASATLRNHDLDARQPFLEGEPQGATWNVSTSASGSLLPGRTGVALTLSGRFDTESVPFRASAPDGLGPAPTTRDTQDLRLALRGQQVLGATHTLRLEYQHGQEERDRLGVGGLDLPVRAYRQTTSSALLRLSDTGALGSRATATFRLQAQRHSLENVPGRAEPAVDVLGAFGAGGAQASGERRLREIQLSADVDLLYGPFTLQVGGAFGASGVDSTLSFNRNGTYTFSSLDALVLGGPFVYSRRAGDPRTSLARREWGAYLQAARVSTRGTLALNGGVRVEGQSGLPGREMAVSPRLLLTWSPPFDRGLTLRLGAGLFRPWVDIATLEQLARLGGRGEADYFVACDAPPAACATQPEGLPSPPSIVRADEHLGLPVGRRASLSAERHLVQGHLHVQAMLAFTSWRGLLRSRNDNAVSPLGLRADPALGNVVSIESRGHGQDREGHLHVTYAPSRRFVVGAQYWWSSKRNDTAGPFALAAGDGTAEEGPAPDDVRHRALLLSSFSLPRGFSVDLAWAANSGAPYDITTGRDDNQDGVFSDRPQGVARNAGRGASAMTFDARVEWRQKRRASATRSSGQVTVATADSADASERDAVSFSFYVTNLFNRFNPERYVGVVTSPAYGWPASAMPGRRLSFRMAFSF